MKFLVINGPNLNLTQFTEPGMEGQIDFNTLLDYIEAGCAQMDVQVDFFQSNHEGDLIDEIQSAAGRADGIILNPGGYAHYSVAILDALRLCGVPAVEVLLSEPRLLLLDEPTKGLDAFFKDKLAALLRSLTARGTTVLMVSHDIEFCASYADRCALFFDGDVVTTNPPRQFFASNSFYTTAANRISRGFFENVVTVEEVEELCRS